MENQLLLGLLLGLDLFVLLGLDSFLAFLASCSAIFINYATETSFSWSYSLIPRASLISLLLIGHPFWKIAFPKIYRRAFLLAWINSCFSLRLRFWLAFFLRKYSGKDFYSYIPGFSVLYFYISCLKRSLSALSSIQSGEWTLKNFRHSFGAVTVFCFLTSSVGRDIGFLPGMALFGRKTACLTALFVFFPFGSRPLPLPLIALPLKIFLKLSFPSNRSGRTNNFLLLGLKTTRALPVAFAAFYAPDFLMFLLSDRLIAEGVGNSSPNCKA